MANLPVDTVPMQFEDLEGKSIKDLIYSAVLCKGTPEYKLFHMSVDKIHNLNVQETGYDPRVDGPPEHIIK